MRNLEQIRADGALTYVNSGAGTRGKEGGNVLKKLPALIMGNGLMAAGAFGYAQKDGSGWKDCFAHIAKHLSRPEIGIVNECDTLDKLMEYLAKKADSQTLKLATDETLAWLTYARRFEIPSEDDHDSND